MTQPDDMVAKLANKASTFAFPLELPVKVALVEDQTKARENSTWLINSFSDFTCVCSCESAEEALAIIPEKLPMWCCWISSCREDQTSNARRV
jgi:hypothetical protein